MQTDQARRQATLNQWQQWLRAWIPQLTRLISQQDWQAIGPLAREIASQLPALAQHPEVKQHFAKELTMLRDLHQLAWQGLDHKSQELGRAMAHLRDNREGLRAYQESQWWS